MNAICVTGFFSSGSSAVMDYLSEFDNTSFIKGRDEYEHSTFYIGDGLFELFDRLYSDRSNYLSRSHALNQFVDLIKIHYKNNFGWFGSYKKLLGEQFLEISNIFFDSISSKQGVAVDPADYKGVYFSLFKGFLQIVGHFMYGYKISKFGRQYIKNNRSYRYITADEQTFIKNCKLYLERYAELCNIESKDFVVFDHLLSAEQTLGLNFFLPENYRVIIVDRNPIDLYLLSKYVWDKPKHYYHPPVPLDVNDFCFNYIFQRRNIDRIKQMDNVLYVRFEDLVINYEVFSKTITEFCGLTENHHKMQMQYFDPKKSKNNIGLISLYSHETKNIDVIKKLIPQEMFTYVSNDSIKQESLF